MYGTFFVYVCCVMFYILYVTDTNWIDKFIVQFSFS